MAEHSSAIFFFHTMRNFLIACALVFGCSLAAQQYVPFPVDSARWNCSFSPYSWWCAMPAHDYEYFISGDTLIGPTVYHKVNVISWSADAACYDPGSGYYGCIREDSSKHVWFRPYWLGYDTLLYDFNVQVGDTLRTFQNPCLETVTLIDSVLIGSTYRKQYHINAGFWCGNYSVVIIEGIGSSGGLFEPFGQYMAHNTLDCFSHNGQTLYPYPAAPCAPLVENINPEPALQEWSAAPNPALDAVTLTSPALQQGTSYSAVLWNVAGERVSVQECASQNGNMIIERNGLAEGTYFVEVISGQQTIARVKVIFL